MYEPKYGSPFVVEGVGVGVGLVVRGGLRSPVTRIFPQPWGGLWPPSLTRPWGAWTIYHCESAICPQQHIVCHTYAPYHPTSRLWPQLNAPSSHPNLKDNFSSILIRLLDSKTLNSQLNPNLLCSAVELQRGSVTTMLSWKIFSPII